MNQWDPKANEIFVSAMEIDEQERQRYLSSACQGDAKLLQQVHSLIAAADQAGSFLEYPSDTVAHTPVEHAGTVIGPYKLREQLGQGGMGVVYAAEQEHPVRRKVALKIIKPGMDSREVISRFEAERQALAMMDHQNIARVLDAGTTDTGLPYFVMELVRGVSVTEYCDKNRLSVRERLELFTQICKAVQHAHQKGIIHRDIKPSNVMVTLHDGVPVPKVIDFGVAKAINQRLTEGTVYTKVAQMLGTPAYMSPEQAELSGLDIDTRSDIYSLGVMLYELLTGSTPFTKEQLSHASFDEMRRVIRETDPQRPSERISTLKAKAISTVANDRSNDPRKLSILLRGELDWIVMKALEKDRVRRYETANEFANDINRYLGNEPVLARPATVTYRLSKFAKRNKGKLVIGSAVFSSLLIACAALAYSTITGWYQQNRTQNALADARQGQERLEGLSEFIITGLISEAEPNGIGNPKISVHDAMLALEHKLDSTLINSPDIRAWVLGELGHYLQKLGRYEDSRRILAEAYSRMELIYGDRDKATLTVGRRLAWTLSHLNIHDEAIPFAREIAERTTDEYGDVPVVTACWDTLGVAYYRADQYDEAEQAFRKSIAISEKIGVSDVAAIANLGDIYYERRDFDQAEQYYLQALKLHQKNGDDAKIQTMQILDDLAFLYHGQGNSKRAKQTLQEVLDKKRQVLGKFHPSTLRTIDFLAQAEYRLGENDQALVLFEEFSEGNRQHFGESSMRYANALHSLAIGRQGVKDLPGAFDACRQAVRIATKEVGEQHSETMLFTFTLMSFLRDLRRWDEAQVCAAKVVAYRKQRVGNNPEELSRLAAAYLFQGLLWKAQGKHEQALKVYDIAVGLLQEQIKTDSHFRVRQYLCDTLRWRSTALRHVGRFKESLADAKQARIHTDSLDEQLDCDLRRAQTLAEMDQSGEAIDITEGVLKELGNEGYLLTRAAAVYGICSRRIVNHASVADHDETAVELYIDRALELLKKAADLGEFDDPFSHLQLKENPDFEQLLENDEFEAFIKTLIPAEKANSDVGAESLKRSEVDQK